MRVTSVEYTGERKRRHGEGWRKERHAKSESRRIPGREGVGGYVNTRRKPNNPQLDWAPILPNRQVREYTTVSALLRMPSDYLVPGQPVPLPRGPALQLGSGIYTRNGEPRASLFGTPIHQGSVRLSPLCTWFQLSDGSARLGY